MHSRTLDLCCQLSLFAAVLGLPACGGPREEWKERATLSRLQCGIQTVAVAPDGRTIAAAESTGTVRLWDLATRTDKACLEGHTAPLTSLAFSRDGKVLASSGRDRAVRIWDVETGRSLACLDGKQEDAGPTGRLAGHAAGVLAVSFTPDGETLAAGCADGNVAFWEVRTGRLRCRSATGHRIVQALAYSPDGRTLATAGLDGNVRLWEPAGSADSAPRERALLRGHTGQVLALVFAPDGRTLYSGGWEGEVRSWDPETGTERGRWEAIDGQVQSLAVSPDGRTVATGGSHQTLRLWEASTSRLQAALEGHKEWVTGLAFTPDGRSLLSAGGGDGTVRIWELCRDR